MVTKGAVVGVLLDSHQLHTIIPNLLDVRQHLVCKFPVLGDTAMLSAHTNVSLIDFQVLGCFANPWVLELVLRLEVDSVEQVGFVVLHDVASPGWIAIHFCAVWCLDLNLVLLTFGKSR